MRSTIASLLVLCKKHHQGIPCMFFVLGFLFGLMSKQVVDGVVELINQLS